MLNECDIMLGKEVILTSYGKSDMDGDGGASLDVNYTDNSNPMLGTKYFCVGRIIEVSFEYGIKVKWDNGSSNHYGPDHLTLAEEILQIKTIKGKISFCDLKKSLKDIIPSILNMNDTELFKPTNLKIFETRIQILEKSVDLCKKYKEQIVESIDKIEKQKSRKKRLLMSWEHFENKFRPYADTWHKYWDGSVELHVVYNYKTYIWVITEKMKPLFGTEIEVRKEEQANINYTHRDLETFSLWHESWFVKLIFNNLKKEK